MVFNACSPKALETALGDLQNHRVKKWLLWWVLLGCLAFRVEQIHSRICSVPFKNPAALQDFSCQLQKKNKVSVGGFSEFFKKHLLEKTKAGPQFSAFQVALWFGDLSQIPFWLIQKYRERGLLQVLALSGQHVGSLALCLSFLLSGLFKRLLKPRGRLLLWARKIKIPLGAGLLMSLAPSESSLIRTCLCVIFVFLIREIPVLVQKECWVGFGLGVVLTLFPLWIFERGFQLSLLGIIGVWIAGSFFSYQQKLLAMGWLALWFVPISAAYFGKWVGDSFFVQVGMAFVWDQIFLPLLFISGSFALILPTALTKGIVLGFEEILEHWLNWEALRTETGGVFIYRPNGSELALFLVWLVALAHWNRNRWQNVPKKNAYGATCIDLTRGARSQ